MFDYIWDFKIFCHSKKVRTMMGWTCSSFAWKLPPQMTFYVELWAGKCSQVIYRQLSRDPTKKMKLTFMTVKCYLLLHLMAWSRVWQYYEIEDKEIMVISKEHSRKFFFYQSGQLSRYPTFSCHVCVQFFKWR